MKKFIIAFLAVAASLGLAQAVPTYTGNLVNGTACTSTTYPLNLNTNKIDYLSMQANTSSGTLTAKTFTDGSASTGSFTVNSISNYGPVAATNSITLGSTAALAAAKASNSLTVVSGSASALTGLVLTVNGTQLIGGRDWTPVNTSTGTAIAIKNVLDVFPGLDASVVGSVVFTTAAANGLSGNSFTMQSSSSPLLSVASLNFTGGREQQLTSSVLTINGTPYRNGYLWKTADTSSGTATSIASMVNNITGLSATASSLVVTLTATTAGAAGNNFTITSSTPTAMTAGSANFTTGRSSASVTINGTTLMSGTDWTTGASTGATAQAISNAIVASAALSGVVTSTWTNNVVTVTSALTGLTKNFAISSNVGGIAASGALMTGGTDSAYFLNGTNIVLPNNGFTTGTSVRYSTGVVAITGLTNQSTYYVISVDANNIKLASTYANSLAGTAITLGSASLTGPHTFTLTPPTLTGTASFKWQESNDNTNWVDMNVSSVTFSSPYTSTTTFWDFGYLTPQSIRINFVGPATGCISLQVIGNGKSSNP